MPKPFPRAALLLPLILLAGPAQVAARDGKAEPVKWKLSGPVKEFRVTAAGGEIRPDTILARRGDRILIVFESRDAGYEVRIKEFGIRKDLPPRESITLELVPTRTGIFPFRFSRGGMFGGKGIKGKIVVR